jgi:hypothetical protein
MRFEHDGPVGFPAKHCSCGICVVENEVISLTSRQKYGVKETRLGTSLAGLRVALGFEVRAVKDLPATREAKKSLLDMIPQQTGSF